MNLTNAGALYQAPWSSRRSVIDARWQMNSRGKFSEEPQNLDCPPMELKFKRTNMAELKQPLDLGKAAWSHNFVMSCHRPSSN